MPEGEMLLAAFETLRERRHVVVAVFDQPGGIVTLDWVGRPEIGTLGLGQEIG